MSTMLMYARGVLAHFLDDEAPVDVSWDPEERYADLLESGALAEETSARGATARNAAYRNGLADKSLTADADAKLGSPQQQAQMYHTATEYSYEPLARYNALAHTFKAHKGAKSVEETEALRQVCMPPISSFPHPILVTTPPQKNPEPSSSYQISQIWGPPPPAHPLAHQKNNCKA